MPYYGVTRDPELSFCGVYRIDPADNSLSLLVDDFSAPNGLAFSVDQRQLYVNDSEKRHIRRFEVNDDGTLSGGDVWADTVGATTDILDGLKVDAEGNVYTTGPGGIQVFTPDATCVGVIRVPVLNANFTWGDDDMRSIFIPASQHALPDSIEYTRHQVVLRGPRVALVAVRSGIGSGRGGIGPSGLGDSVKLL